MAGVQLQCNSLISRSDWLAQVQLGVAQAAALPAAGQAARMGTKVTEDAC